MTVDDRSRVLVAGSVSLDENRVGRRVFRKLGGVCTYAGLTYAREGLTTTVVTNAAPGDARLLRALADRGLTLHVGPAGRTTAFVNRVGRSGRRQSVTALAPPIAYAALAASAAASAWAHLGPLHPDDLRAEVYDRLAERRVPVVLDIQGLVRRVHDGQVVPCASPLLPNALRSAAVVKSSESEARVATRALAGDIETLMERFQIAEWVVTRGARGGSIHARGAAAVDYPAEPSDLRDPTGAGDVFLAAYTAERLARRAPVAQAAQRAAATAARQVSGAHIAFSDLQILDLPDGRPAVEHLPD